MLWLEHVTTLAVMASAGHLPETGGVDFSPAPPVVSWFLWTVTGLCLLALFLWAVKPHRCRNCGGSGHRTLACPIAAAAALSIDRRVAAERLAEVVEDMLPRYWSGSLLTQDWTDVEVALRRYRMAAPLKLDGSARPPLKLMGQPPDADPDDTEVFGQPR